MSETLTLERINFINRLLKRIYEVTRDESLHEENPGLITKMALNDRVLKEADDICDMNLMVKSNNKERMIKNATSRGLEGAIQLAKTLKFDHRPAAMVEVEVMDPVSEPDSV